MATSSSLVRWRNIDTNSLHFQLDLDNIAYLLFFQGVYVGLVVFVTLTYNVVGDQQAKRVA